MEILIVEDDAVLGAVLEKGLSEIGHECIWTQSGSSAVELLELQSFDVMILDLMLPDLPGLEVLKQLRKDKRDVSVLVLTALGSIDDRVRGLNSVNLYCRRLDFPLFEIQIPTSAWKRIVPVRRARLGV